ncbi:MAG: SHOCT domain-containing protein [Polyangiaceae bacterium]|nr:SHOCT domain-containing protein [Polyangiaceae bacterium]
MVQHWLFGDPGDDKDVRCKRLIERCGYGAAALTILPIPGSEIIAVMPLHVGMVVGIAELHGVELSRSSATELVLKIGATVGLSLVGSRVAMTAGKILLPGLGGIIAAPFMYASTLAIGAVARAYFKGGGELVESEMRAVYEDTVKRAKETFDPRRAKSEEAQAVAREAAAEADKAPGAAGAAAAPASAPEPARGAASVDELGERLGKLEMLRARGAISDADYERRKAEILDEI